MDSTSSLSPVVLVTGASKGIGFAVTRILLEKRAIVATISRSRTPQLTSLLTENPTRLFIQDCDIADSSALKNALSIILKTFYRLDAVVLNAGTLGPLERIAGTSSLSEWKSCFDVNFFSLVQILQHVTKPLSESKYTGRVVFVSSGAAVGNMAAWGAYNTSKAAMNSLCRTFANEEPNIIAVAVRPGMVATNMQAELREKGKAVMKKEELSRFTGAHDDGTLISPEIPAFVIASLALQAKRSLSGLFVSWNGEECEEYRNL